MNKQETLLLTLESIEIAQSLIIAIFLIFLHFKNRKKSMLLLALYFLFYGISSVIQTGEYLKFIQNNFAPITSAFQFIAYAFFYAHIDSLLIHSNKKRVSRIFAIGIFAFLIGITISLCAFFVQNPLLYLIGNLLILFKFIFLLYVTVVLIVNIRKHNKLVTYQYSNTENRKLRFLFYWVIVFMAFLISFLVIEPKTYLSEFAETIISLIWTLGLAYNALFHQISENLFEKKEANTNTSFNTTIEENTTKNNVINETHLGLIKKIEQQIEANQLFLNPELTISNLSDLVDEHPKLVSQVINAATHQNFNNYINKFRVMYAKNMLLNAKNKHLNIEGIGNLSGFKSNSTFYSAFKKHLNCTPLQFQKRQHL